MNSSRFLAFVLLVAAQSSSALTITIEGEEITVDRPSKNRMVITASDSSGGTNDGGTNDGGTSGDGTNDGGTSGGGTNDGGTSDGGTNDGGTVVDGDCSPNDIHQLARQSLPGSTEFYNFERGEAYAFRFTGQAGERGQIRFTASTKRGNGNTRKLVTLTPCAGDFDYPSFSTAQLRTCVTAGTGGGLYFEFGHTASSQYCQLEPGQTYYFNIRNFCESGELCGFGLSSNEF